MTKRQIFTLATVMVLSLAGIVVSSALFSGCSLTATVSIEEDKEAVETFNKTSYGLALAGYDAVAYFQEGKAVPGSAEFDQEWEGAKWHFSSATNRDLFVQSPWNYAPQFGGYCAWAVGHGYTANGDPEVWKIVNGKLYLNYNQEVKKMWEPDQESWIEKGDKNWPDLVKGKD